MPWIKCASCCNCFIGLSWLLVFGPLASTTPAKPVSDLKFTLEPRSRVFTARNREFVIDCVASGRPLPVVTWTRNDLALKEKAAVRVDRRGGLHFVSGVQESSSDARAVFRCVATNSAGVLRSKKVRVEIIYLKNISVSLSPVVVGKAARLECRVSSNQPVTFTWFKHNSTINQTADARIKTLPNGVLQIRDYRPSDDGMYSCRAENKYERITSSAVQVVGQSSTWTKLGTYPQKVVSIASGSPLVLECVQPGSMVSWTKISRAESNASVLASGESFANLVFDPVLRSDGGEYRCQGTDGTHKVVVATVKFAPGFIRKPPDVTNQNLGDKLTLTCDVEGDPAPLVTWYKDGQSLAGAKRIHLAQNKTVYRLHVDKLTPSDAGVYQCEAENELGSSMAYTVLQVIAEPVITAYPVSATEINVTWTSPHGTEKEMFSVHYESVGKLQLQHVKQDGRRYHVIKHLKPYTDYVIYVIAYAYDGKRRPLPSRSVTIKTLEKEPSGPPTYITLKSYSQGTLDVTWLPPTLDKRNGRIIGYAIVYYAAGNSRKHRITDTSGNYTRTLSGLREGNNYVVQIAAQTSVGLGPFSEKSMIVSRKPGHAVLPAPIVETTVEENGVRVKVNGSDHLAVRGYRLTYRNMEDKRVRNKTVIIQGRTFDYVLQNLMMNSEYVIYVSAMGAPRQLAKPAIVVVATKRNLPALNKQANMGGCHEVLPPIDITCHPALNSTALVLKWQRSPLLQATGYLVRYFKLGERHKVFESTTTRRLNVTLRGLTPGEVYEVEIKSLFRDAAKTCSAVGVPQSGNCALPEINPGTPPSNISCEIDFPSSIVVKWRPPSKPNGEIVKYHVTWLNSGGTVQQDMIPVFRPREEFSFTIRNLKKRPRYVVSVYGENVAGMSPPGHCVIDTTTVKVLTDPPSVSTDKRKSEGDSDIKMGIVIGCVISLLFVVFLAAFVTWSDPCGCRSHKPLRDAETTVASEDHSVNRKSKQDTFSTETSDISSKHYQILQKYLADEASKESDRGLGMTPKNSRLCLDHERSPMLQNKESQENSTDTSFDSQDSGIQGLRKQDKGPSSSNGRSDAAKSPRTSKKGVQETKC